MSGGEEDSNSVFLLPFDCKPVYELINQTGDDEQESSVRNFKTLLLTVPSDVPDDPDPAVKHSIDVGDYVLLRPQTNGSPPFVGKVMKFYVAVDGKKSMSKVRINWYYRPSDLLEKPRRTPGEDEVLETPHFNDIDVDTIVGRCTVTDYQQYIKLVGKEQNVSAVPLFDGDNQDDDSESNGTFFWDNYSSSSTRLFCRDYYDACADVLVTSSFDDPSVDPLAEIETPGRNGESSDESASFGDSESLDLSEDEFDVKKTGGTRPRKRLRHTKSGASSGTATTARGQAGSLQFCLPADISGEDELPCRDIEKAAVRKFLETTIRDSGSDLSSGDRCIYISGVPGTGKTATVREVIRRLKALQAKGDIPPFEVVEVNGMSLPQPSLIYSEVYAAIVGKRGVPPDRSKQLLEARFRQSSTHAIENQTYRSGAAQARIEGKCVILVLDEMDVLVSRNQELLYDMLEWTTRRDSRLAVVGIANTMDLPERLLPRLKSRMGSNRIVYPPYTKDQLMQILDLTVRDWPVHLEESAKKLVAAKVAAVSGDVRRALELCRRAKLVAVSEDKAAANSGRSTTSKVLNVTVTHVNTAVGEMTGDQRLKCVRNLSAYEKLIIISALVLSRAIGAFDMEASSSLSAIFARARQSAAQLPQIFKGKELVTEDLQGAVSRLVAQRIVLLEHAAKPLDSRLVVNVSPEDCMFALAEDDIAKAILQ